MEIASLILLVLAYPFLAAWLVGIGRGSRLAALEREISVLRARVEASTPSPSPESAPGAAKQGHEPAAALPEAQAPDRAGEESAAPLWPLAPRNEHEAALEEGTDADEVATEQAAPTMAPAHAAAQAATPGDAGLAPDATDDPQASAAADTQHAPATQGGATPPPSSTAPGWAAAAMGWLLNGNLVAKLGLVILFIGVGFLLKYVAETVTVPIEARLAGVVVATLALLGWGWRLRSARRDIGLPVQGTAIAILMLVVFGAYHRYDLIPSGFAFALLVALTAFTCLLAVLQESPWLAAFGITGGFASPLLLSTGGGNHVGLFSYYALLNTGVFFLAIKRAWRPLNLIGFAFTFIVGSAWGTLRYTPEHYLSAQLFLALFFVFYVGIAVAFARQQHTRLKDPVDGTLVLGTPLAAFALQAGLVKDMEFGLAFSALVLGVFYMTLGVILWRRAGARWRVLVETFMALGVVFGTLAIPFAVDGRWTSGVWALEGAGFAWLGLRRQQRLTWVFGVLLQAGAWMGFIGAISGIDPDAARDANLWLGFLLLAGSAFAMARGFRQQTGDQHPALLWIANCFLVTAAGWFLAGIWTEAILHTGGGLRANLLTAGALLTAGLLYLSGARLAWPLARRLAVLAQLAAAIALMSVSTVAWQWLSVRETEDGEPLLGVLMIALAALASACMSRRSPDPQSHRHFPLVFLLWGGAWWFGPGMSIAASRLLFALPAALGPADARWSAMYALLAGVSAIACTRLAPRLAWPELRWLGTSSWAMLAVFTLVILSSLYGTRTLPEPGVWLAWALLWSSSEYVLLRWNAGDASGGGLLLRVMHALRSAGPWLAIWPTGAILVGRWLAVPGDVVDTAEQTAWASSPAWGNYLPTWVMMLALAWLAGRSRAGRWPATPLPQWYQRVLIPCGALLLLALTSVWNLVQDGSMAPLPYLPLLNPLDLTTGFVLFLSLGAARAALEGQGAPGRMTARLQASGVAAAWVWCNLIFLRSAAQYRDIPYRVDALAASQFVQAMLSLVWCASALVLMRFAAVRAVRGSWCLGAVLLGVVVLKLLTFDLANSGSLARVVSFVGVGLLMILIGYFAPFPKADRRHAMSTQGA